MCVLLMISRIADLAYISIILPKHGAHILIRFYILGEIIPALKTVGVILPGPMNGDMPRRVIFT